MSEHCSCIDISHWQGFPDFEEVAAQGVVAAIMKATEGTSYIDPNRATNFVNANAAGIACCTYHWIKPGDAKSQMEFFLEVVDPVNGERMVIDYEEDGCTLDDLHKAIEALKADPRGLQVTVYSGHLLKEQLGDQCDDYLRDNTDLWLAQYTSGDPSWPSGTYDKWTLWQFSESGELDGINDTNVDLNRFDGTDEELVKWISPAGVAPPKPPEPEPDEAVTIDIMAPEDVPVLVTVNGDEIRTRRRRQHRLLVPRGPDLR
ncbi:lysozyme [Bradyrhizobium barranii subsp. barranii]|uniref:glycoside hydrolase family 25 protein n=1 Tax=Bradyrhizobium TaxID=374 RepID=UPI001BA92807|nr:MULTISPECIES: glycoside hydrolase family 25 protein [Bradyrhizobium]MBR0879638.1 glycoside hydrolase family 25 protein [Bradyrhizobium liaoningense]MCP1778808.1 lysozyme [Bradyrhizobium japonicum]MCP1958194.1 lysozyme [Bradyrhizobium japonicum]